MNDKELEVLAEKHGLGQKVHESLILNSPYEFIVDDRALACLREVRDRQREEDATKLKWMEDDVDSNHWRVALQRGAEAIRKTED